MNSGRYEARYDPSTNDMMRDLTMIISVIVAVASLGFGVYKNIEAGNARGFAYEQAYRIIGQIQEANISQAVKTQMTAQVIASLGAPVSVFDVGRSGAATIPSETCNAGEQSQCLASAQALGEANVACTKLGPGSVECQNAVQLSEEVRACIKCFIQ